MPPKKLIGTAAFVAALTGGAAAGALLGVPSVSSAQTDPSSSSSDATTPTPEDGDCAGGFRGGHGFLHGNLDAAATALGITAEELRTELEAGKSIADVAGEKGVDVQTVIDALVAAATTKIDEALANGDITQEKADELKTNLVDRITDVVNRTKPEGFRGGPGRHGPHDHPADDTTDDTTSGS